MKLLFIIAVLALGVLIGYALSIPIADLYHPYYGKYLAQVPSTQGITLLPGQNVALRPEIPLMPGCHGVVLDRESGRAECVKEAWW
jgi:hypothetical protein